MKRFFIALILLLAGHGAFASWQGDLLKGGIDTRDGFIRLDSVGLTAASVKVYTTTETVTLKAKDSGTVSVCSEISDDPKTFVLPPASKGLIFVFIDNDATAAADLIIDPASDDKINNQTAGVTYNATGDAFGETITLLAIDDTNWIVISKIGTWTTGS